MLWNRHDYLNHLTSRSSSREMFVELFGLLVGLEEEWREQGACDEEIALTAFDWDHVERVYVPINLDAVTGLKEQLLEDTKEHRIVIDTMGRRTFLPKGRATLPLPETFPVASAEDWNRIKHWFAFRPDRVDTAALDESLDRQHSGAVLRATMPGAYATMRELMGDERACLAFIDEPDLVVDILETLATLCESAIDCLPAEVVPEELFVHEDFAGRSGPLIGPTTFREFVAPYYERLWARWNTRGTKIFDIDSDGFIEPVVDALIESGVNCVHPLEPAAGMDIVKLRKRYGHNLILRGGLDKFALGRGEDAIRNELEYKMQPCMRGGGVMFGIDHRIPNGTPLEAYRYYVTSGRSILNLPPLSDDSRGWTRMA